MASADPERFMAHLLFYCLDGKSNLCIVSDDLLKGDGCVFRFFRDQIVHMDGGESGFSMWAMALRF